jgi:hypothetical protein
MSDRRVGSEVWKAGTPEQSPARPCRLMAGRGSCTALVGVQIPLGALMDAATQATVILLILLLAVICIIFYLEKHNGT